MTQVSEPKRAAVHSVQKKEGATFGLYDSGTHLHEIVVKKRSDFMRSFSPVPKQANAARPPRVKLRQRRELR